MSKEGITADLKSMKAPFRINIDKAVKQGNNILEVKVTNLWSNCLIGDEQLPLDYERKGNRIKQ